MSNVIELNPQKRTEEKIRRIIREVIDELEYEKEDKDVLEGIIFNLYDEWFNGTSDLQVQYIEGTIVEVVEQIEDFYQSIIHNLICALAAEKFATYKNNKNAHEENNNNQNS